MQKMRWNVPVQVTGRSINEKDLTFFEKDQTSLIMF